SGFTGFVHNMGLDTDASGAIALTAKWFIRLIALVVAFDALGLPAVSDVLRQLLMWIPNLVVGIVVLVIGGLAANALGNLVRGATAQADLGNPDLLAKIAKVAVWAFAIIIAVNQIGVAQTLVNALFIAVVGAAALALGLAFGLGGRDTAAEIVRRWYESSRGVQAKLDEFVKEGAGPGDKVDLIIEGGAERVAIEIKAGRGDKPHAARSLEQAMSHVGARTGFILDQ